MEKDYSIESLCNIFAEHAQISDEQAEQFKLQFPDQEDPSRGFNLARALCFMACELHRLKSINIGR